MRLRPKPNLNKTKHRSDRYSIISIAAMSPGILRTIQSLRTQRGSCSWPSNFRLYLEVRSATHSSEYVTSCFAASSCLRLGSLRPRRERPSGFRSRDLEHHAHASEPDRTALARRLPTQNSCQMGAPDDWEKSGETGTARGDPAFPGHVKPGGALARSFRALFRRPEAPA